MIPVLIMLGAMILGFVAPQVEKSKAMKGVFVPPVITPFEMDHDKVIEPEHVAPMEGKV